MNDVYYTYPVTNDRDGFTVEEHKRWDKNLKALIARCEAKFKKKRGPAKKKKDTQNG